MVATTTAPRTQAQRSAETIAKLLTAARSVLADSGYQGMTTSLVAKRAGVSRGALLHHFPNRAALVVATAEKLIESEVHAFRDAMASLPATADRYHAAIDFLWRLFQSDEHLAWTELSLGARSDPDVADDVRRVGEMIHTRIADTWAELFPEARESDIADIAPDFSTALLDGLAQHKLSGRVTAERADEVVDSLKGLSTLFFTPDGDLP